MLIRVKKHCCNWRKLQMKKLNPYILFQKINTGTYITMNSFKQKLSHQYQQWIWISELGTVVMQHLLQRLTWPHDFWPDPIVFLKTDMDLTPLHNTHVCSFQKFIFQFVCIYKNKIIFLHKIQELCLVPKQTGSATLSWTSATWLSSPWLDSWLLHWPSTKVMQTIFLDSGRWLKTRQPISARQSQKADLMLAFLCY